MEENKYMNPYLAGFLLGLLLLVTIFITGRGLGASGAVKSAVVEIANIISPSHVESSKFYSEYLQDHQEGPLKNWLVFEILGVIVGAFVSGLISNRLRMNFELRGKSTKGIRIFTALLGGALFGFGSQLGRGCTSGAALSGMAVLSTGGMITMAAIFGGAYAFAFFFRKLWITKG